MASLAYTPKGLAAALRQFGKELYRPIINAMRRGLTMAKGIAERDFASRGIGRAIFGAKPSGIRKQKLITRTRVTRRGNVFRGGLQARGFAALQDAGGKTKGHWIKPSLRTALKLKTAGGPFFTREPVWHLGSNMPRIRFLEAAIQKAAPRIRDEMDKEIQKLISARLE